MSSKIEKQRRKSIADEATRRRDASRIWSSSAAHTFTFQPRWKEELICTCTAGSFILQMPMGVVSVDLPSLEAWSAAAPSWAKALWSTLYAELSEWCALHKFPLYVSDSASAFWSPDAEPPNLSSGLSGASPSTHSC
jgi:hypothetical protein